VENEKFHKALVATFGQAKVDAFPMLLLEAMKELFDRGRALGTTEEKGREEVEGEAEREDVWKDAYDTGWNDYAVENRKDIERQIDNARQDGYDTAIDEQIQNETPRIGFPKKEKTA